MKEALHPNYFPSAKINCSNCGQEFEIGGTKEGIRVEICSHCHPFYTGKKTLIDTEGRIDKFRQKMANIAAKDKKIRKKKTLEERVNEELADQLKKEKELVKPKKAK